MPANTSPIFLLTPRLESVVSAATSVRDGSSGTLYSLFVSNSSNGSRIEKITCMQAATSSASSAIAVRVYCCDAAGNNPRIIREALLAATTPSATVLGAVTTFNFTGGLLLGTNSSIYVGQSTYAGAQDRCHWSAEGGDF